MEEIKWNDRFNLGVESIDRAHQRIFSIVGKLISLNEDEAKQRHACQEGIKYLKSYTLKHFQEEEDYMQSIGYEGYARHKRQVVRMFTLDKQYPVYQQYVAEIEEMHRKRN